MNLVATGFYAHGLGIRGQRTFQTSTSVGALDDSGKERKTYGGYIQGTFDFGQGTSVGYSYGVMIPGQFGPINLELLLFRTFFTLSISTTGMPSVIQTINSILASIASSIAAPANFGGT